MGLRSSRIKIANEQAKNEVWSKVISWVEQGNVPEKDKDKKKSKRGFGGAFHV